MPTYYNCFYDFMSENDYLAHHGIKGQKWGVRRFQNEDGSYTEKGKKRKKVSEMSDAELDRAIKRAKKEQEYKKYYKTNVKVPGFIKNALTGLATTALTAAVGYGAYKVINKYGGHDLAKILIPNMANAMGNKTSIDLSPLKENLGKVLPRIKRISDSWSGPPKPKVRGQWSQPSRKTRRKR